MGIRKNTQHAKGLVVFDEAHAAHVRRKLENSVDVLGRFHAGLSLLQVKDPVIGGGILLVPVVKRLDVNRTNTGRAIGKQLVHQMSADKATCSTH
jgi:hypothetical protein